MRMTFILGSPRTGTTILAILLGRAKGVFADHEPFIGPDVVRECSVLRRWDRWRSYILGERRKRTLERAASVNASHYIEVTPRLPRYYPNETQDAFPDSQVFRLYRDGRDAVRSLLNMGYYNGGRRFRNIRPPEMKRWNGMTSFERACWLWADINRRMREADLPVLRYENLRPFSSFERIAEAVGVEIPLNIYRATIRMRVNQGAFPEMCRPWYKWTPSQRRQFELICGEEMNADQEGWSW